MLIPESIEPADDRNASGRTPPASGKAVRAALVHRQRRVRAGWDEVREFLDRLSSQVAQEEYSVCLVSDRSMRRYNRQFRQRSEATDVLSFPADHRVPDDSDRTGYLGDIIISVDTALDNARRYGLRLEDEIKLLALHGVLHLLGYDHHHDGGRMARLERQWAVRLGLPQSLIRRTRSANGLS